MPLAPTIYLRYRPAGWRAIECNPKVSLHWPLKYTFAGTRLVCYLQVINVDGLALGCLGLRRTDPLVPALDHVFGLGILLEAGSVLWELILWAPGDWFRWEGERVIEWSSEKAPKRIYEGVMDKLSMLAASPFEFYRERGGGHT